jgi:hypothetical protein
MESPPLVFSPFLNNYSESNPEILYATPYWSESVADYNPIVLCGGAINIFTDETKTAEIVRREREIFDALESGRIVCVICSYDRLIGRILARICVDFSTFPEPRVDVIIKRSEFNPFLKKYGAAELFFTGDFDDIICKTRDNQIIGFAKKVEKGTLIFLPCAFPIEKCGEWEFMEPLSASLLEALRTYGPRIQYSPPNWISSFKFSNEAQLASQKEMIQKSLEKVDNSIREYLRLKEILWFRNNELVDSVINFLNAINIRTIKDEISEEDFWIMEGDKEAVIVEVKGLDRNLARQHISQLDEHRAAREKPDDFPALLIVNSFNRATSMKEKDIPISSNEIKKAIQMNVLVLRTLDLCNAFCLIEENKLKNVDLLEVIKKEHGWLNITSRGLHVVKS